LPGGLKREEAGMGVSASKRKGWNEGTPEGLMTPEQVMAYLKCGRSHIFSLPRTGEIPSLKGDGYGAFAGKT
jgi:hypothetical protein